MSDYHGELLSTGQKGPDNSVGFVNKSLLKLNKSNDFSNKTLLDVGCGNGIITAQLSQLIKFKQIDGVEINKFAIENLLSNPKENPFTNLYNEDILDFQPKEKYDFCILVEVLEHLYLEDVIPTLQKLSKICKSLIITTPHPSSCFQLRFNLEEIKRTINDVDELNNFEFEAFEGAIHKSTVTPFSMRQAGFKVSKHDYDPNYVNNKWRTMIYFADTKNLRLNKIRIHGVQKRNEINNLKLNYLNLIIDTTLFFPMFNFKPSLIKKLSYYFKKLKSYLF
jgi:trans-aconitate 2-methyltransferase